MKKYIAITLIFTLILTLVACGSKQSDPQNEAAGGETVSQVEGTQATTAGNEEADDDSTVAPEATATSTPEENQVTATTPKEESTNKEDIKVPVDGDTDVPIETPDDGASSDFVISFDDLMEAN